MSSYYRGAHAVILVYDVTNRNSFAHIEQRWLDQVELYCTRGAEHCVLMLLGNKVDLVSDGKESNRAVPVEEAMALAQSKGMIFAECSSKMNIGLSDAMTSLADQLLTVAAQAGLENTNTGMRLTDYSNTEDASQGACGC